MANWFYAVELQQHGPVPEEQLRDLLTRGAVGSDCLVWTGGMAEWQKASAIKALAATPPPPVPPPSPPAAPLRRDPALLEGTEDFRIGQVFRDTLTALKTRLGTFLLISLVPHLLLVVLLGLCLFGSYAYLLQIGVSRHNLDTTFMVMVVILLIELPIASFAYLIALGAIAYSAFQNICGRSVRFGEAMRQGLHRALPLLGMGVLAGAVLIVAVVIQAIADQLAFSELSALILVVLGTIVGVILFVSLPACMVEKTGQIGSMKRSASLTKGCRWKIFGISLLPALAIGITTIILIALEWGIDKLTNWPESTTVSIFAGLFLLVLFTVIVLLTTALIGVVPAATYVNLRRAEDGITPDEIASVFD